ncbi:MAG: hypothetical protein U9N42_04160, partial [Campylobacterota bacterium]|nr:hypothetical protein [Campylobacterota bacterium]
FIGELKSLIGISNSDDINTALLSPNFVANASAYLGIKSANSEDILMEDIKIAPISQVLDGLLSIANLITISMFTVNNVTNDEIPSEIVAPLFVAKFVVVLIQVSRLDCENTKISDMIALGIVTAGVIVSVFIIFTKNPNTKKIITTIGLSITIAGRVAQSYLSIVKYHCNSETEMDTVLELGIAYPIIGIVQSIAAVVAIWLPADGPIKAGSLAVVWIAWFARFEVLGYKDDELERLSNLSATKFCYL